MSKKDNIIIAELKTLKRIMPREDFARDTKHVLLSAIRAKEYIASRDTSPLITPTRTPIKLFPSLAWVSASLALVVIITTLVLTPTVPSVTAALDSDTLTKEFQNLDINIELKEISYAATRENTISSAMKEIKNTTTQHLNETILENEKETLTVESVTNPAIDTLLHELAQ